MPSASAGRTAADRDPAAATRCDPRRPAIGPLRDFAEWIPRTSLAHGVTARSAARSCLRAGRRGRMPVGAEGGWTLKRGARRLRLRAPVRA
jgi:hypothetical protein